MRTPNRAKIVATMGPSSRSKTVVKRLIKAGVDVFRINAAHTSHKEMATDVAVIRRVARELGAMVGVLVDLQGPKIRVGPFQGGEPIWLRRGDEVVISTVSGVVGCAGGDGQPARVGCSYRSLADDLRAEENILLDDGAIELVVVDVEGTEIRTRVLHGGLLKQFKGVNIPGSTVSAASLSAVDLEDLAVALANEVDFVALSFVRTAEDVRALRKHIDAAGSDACIIAKIERSEAVENLLEILDVADGLMVARGDMGVELGPEAVPALQKQIIRTCVAARKPVITATQMLESMVSNPRPTRAEASDVANAVYDGTSAVMLSAETAAGDYPVQSVQIMDSVIRRTEADMFSDWAPARRSRGMRGVGTVQLATARAAAAAAIEVGARVIAVFTESGTTAQLLSGDRSPTRMVAFTPFQRTVQRLSLTWGVTVAIKLTRTRTSHEMTLEGARTLRERRLVRKGDRVIVLSGTTRTRGMTNTMRIRTVE